MDNSMKEKKKALRKKLEEAMLEVLAQENDYIAGQLKEEVKAAAKRLTKHYAKEHEKLTALQEEAIREAKEKLYEQARQKVKEDTEAQEINMEITFDLEELIAKKLPHLKDFIEEAFRRPGHKQTRPTHPVEELRQLQEELQNTLQEVLIGIFQTAKKPQTNDSKPTDEKGAPTGD
ncbi:MAG: hypothetical protein KatS3mg033_0006 [Thermonema sp.]|uniref:hypothetical protein n=1 Tax=Thermonema sp. TaxID=2231181 RepID=UPI0021DD7FE4|nr:hypothetical protein [Thermonema sp.]GIV38206.1 MAG: hypothetical protein KatS3mg033_0006 [Thermonema sp.]